MSAGALSKKFSTKTQRRFFERKHRVVLGMEVPHKSKISNTSDFHLEKKTSHLENTGVEDKNLHSEKVADLVHAAQQAIELAIIDHAQLSVQKSKKTTTAEISADVFGVRRFPSRVASRRSLVDGVAINDAVLQLAGEKFALTDALVMLACKTLGTAYTEEMRHEIHMALRTHAWSAVAQMPRTQCAEHSWSDLVNESASAFVKLRGVYRETLIADIVHLNTFYPSEGRKEFIHDVLSELFIKHHFRLGIKERVRGLLDAVSEKYLQIPEGHTLCAFHEEIVRAIAQSWGVVCDENLFITSSGSASPKRRQIKLMKKLFGKPASSRHHGYSLPEHVRI